MKVETCQNCGRTIGVNEQAYIYDGKVVCDHCNNSLRYHPYVNQTESILKETIGTGELIEIIYQGGSQPGSVRMISPIKIEKDKVRAHCYTSNKIKLFCIDKIVISKTPNGQTNYVDKKTIEEPKDLNTAMQPFIEELTSLGWHVEFDNKNAGLYRFFKNGKLRKSPDVCIVYDEFDTSYIDWENVEKVRRSRPWYVWSNVAGERAITYKSLRHAMEQFVVYGRKASLLLFNVTDKA